MSLTLRDKSILEFLADFKVASTSTLHELFFKNVSLRFAQKRLKKLDDYGYLKRIRDHFTNEYVYYLNKLPNQLEHRLLLTDFYKKFHAIKDITIDLFENEKTFENLRCDGILCYTYKDGKYIAFIEVQRKSSGRPLDLKKYQDFYDSDTWQKYFPVFPQLIAITNLKVPKQDDYEVIIVKEDFSNIKNIIGNNNK